MVACRRKTFLIACAVLLGGITDARAGEWLNFYPVTGEFSVGLDGRWKSFDSGVSTWRMKYEERLNLRLGGYSVDPRVFSFNINLEPAFGQEDFDSGSGTASIDSANLNYGARFSLLHGVQASPVSLSANFSSNTGETEGSLGNRSDFSAESRGADLHLKFKPFPSTLSYNERSLDETFIPGFGQPPTERENFLRTLTYRGKSRGMELYLEGNEFDDLTVTDQDYESRRARLDNKFNWGRNSRLTSRFEYLNREGFQEEEKVTAVESLRLQHTSNLFTTYGYNYESRHRTSDTDTHSGKFGLNHRLYTNLTTNFSLSGSNSQSDQFEEESYIAGLDFNYNKEIRPGFRIQANLGGGYNVTDRTGGKLDFTESTTVPVTGIVVLTQRFVLWPTIVVTAPGCNPCLDGTDYIVEDAGGDFTQLSIPAGSAINIGDAITVDNVYEPPTVEYYGIPYRAGVRLEYGAYAFYHRVTGEDQTYVSGPDPTAVNDRRTDTTGVEWRWTNGQNTASAGVERVHIEMTDRATTEYLLRQSLTYGIVPNATLRANLSESFLRNGTRSDAYNGDLMVNWFVAPGFSVTPRLTAFRRIVDPGATQSFVKVGVDGLWKWRRLVVNMRYDHTLHDTDGVTRNEDRVFIKLTRKF